MRLAARSGSFLTATLGSKLNRRLPRVRRCQFNSPSKLSLQAPTLLQLEPTSIARQIEEREWRLPPPSSMQRGMTSTRWASAFFLAPPARVVGGRSTLLTCFGGAEPAEPPSARPRWLAALRNEQHLAGWCAGEQEAYQKGFHRLILSSLCAATGDRPSSLARLLRLFYCIALSTPGIS